MTSCSPTKSLWSSQKPKGSPLRVPTTVPDVDPVTSASATASTVIRCVHTRNESRVNIPTSTRRVYLTRVSRGSRGTIYEVDRDGFRAPIAARAYARSCVPLMDSTAAVCATARRVGRAPSAIYLWLIVRFLIAISTGNATEDRAFVIPDGRVSSATNVSLTRSRKRSIFRRDAYQGYFSTMTHGASFYLFFNVQEQLRVSRCWENTRKFRIRILYADSYKGA